MKKEEILKELENIRLQMDTAVAKEDQDAVFTLRKRMTELYSSAEDKDDVEMLKVMRAIADIGPRPIRSQGYPAPPLPGK